MPNFTVQCVASLAATSELPADAVINTFTFFGGGADNTPGIVAGAMEPFVLNWYNDADSPQTNPLSYYIGPQIVRTGNPLALTWREVHLDTGILGPIVRQTNNALGASGSTIPLPAEVALCMTHTADLTLIPEEAGSEHPAARRRGRRYLGPLGFTDATDVVDGYLIPSDLLIADAVEADRRLADTGFEVVWSRAGNTQFEVIQGWVDDEFDTQRRRGRLASGRTNWSV